MVSWVLIDPMYETDFVVQYFYEVLMRSITRFFSTDDLQGISSNILALATKDSNLLQGKALQEEHT